MNTIDAQQATKYSWQFGPYERDPRTCKHRSNNWPHNDTWAVFKCVGERDLCLCRECGEIREFRCNFDEEYN